MRPLLATMLSLTVAAPLEAQDLVLTHGHIVDPAARTVTEGDLWIEDGRIAGVGRAPAGAKGERIELRGGWVIPALHDLHTHSFGNQAPGGVFDGAGSEATAQRVLRAGVTSFLDLFNQEDYIFNLRAGQQAGRLGGAEIFASGPCFTATGGHCSEYGIPTRVIDTPDEARAQLALLAPKRPDVVKLVYDHNYYGPNTRPSVDRPTMEALLAAARERGFQTVIHVGEWDGVREVVLAGATAVTHVPRGDTAPDDVVRLLAERGTYYIPTLVVHLDLAELLARPELRERPLFVALASAPLRAAYAKGMEGHDPRYRPYIEGQITRRETTLATVRRLAEAGVPMLTGTDGGNLGVVQGWSVHREMWWLVQAGLTPWDALRASTTTAGRFLGRAYGVAPGDQADLVVLEASPLEDIANTEGVRLVLQRGRVMFRR